MAGERTNVHLLAGELVIAEAVVERADRTIIEKDTKTHQARRIAIDAGTDGVASPAEAGAVLPSRRGPILSP